MTKKDIIGMAEAGTILRTAVREWNEWNEIAPREWFFVVARGYARSLRDLLGMEAGLRYERALDAWEQAMRRHSGLMATYVSGPSTLDDSDRELLQQVADAEARAADALDAEFDTIIRRFMKAADACPPDVEH